MRTTKAAGRFMPGLAVAIGAAVLLAACSSSAGVATLDGTDDARTPAPTTDADPDDPEQGRLAFAQCMRDNGIDMPDPQPGGGGFRIGSPDGSVEPPFDPHSAEFQSAMETCRDHLAQGFAGPGGHGELTEEQEQALLDFAECMRDNGIDMPDPTTSGGVAFRSGPGGMDPNSSEFQTAIEACRDHLESMGGGVRINR